jgi:hypothetical protein
MCICTYIHRKLQTFLDFNSLDSLMFTKLSSETSAYLIKMAGNASMYAECTQHICRLWPMYKNSTEEPHVYNCMQHWFCALNFF